MVKIDPEYKLISNKLIWEKNLSSFWFYNKSMTNTCAQHTSAMQSTFLSAQEECPV